MDDVNVGKLLKNIRESKNLTQEDVANALNIGRNAIVRIEQGNRKISADELWDSRIPEKIKTKLRLYDTDSFIANAIFNGKTGNEHDLDFKNFDNIDDILDYAGY